MTAQQPCAGSLAAASTACYPLHVFHAVYCEQISKPGWLLLRLFFAEGQSDCTMRVQYAVRAMATWSAG